MKISEIKLIQKYLKSSNFYSDEINGKLDSHTRAAIEKVLSNHSHELPAGWQAWSAKRKSVAYLQIAARDNNIDSGQIDGLYGPQTEAASQALAALSATGSPPRAFEDITPLRENPNNFPVEQVDALDDFYGKPCAARLVKVPCPWVLRLDWDLRTTTRTISIHEKLSDSLERILNKAYQAYGIDGIKKYGLDRYGGSFNCRKKRGSTSAWSTHAWGISIDWFPSKNKLKWRSDKASLAHEDLDAWWELWEKEGWVSLGRSEDRDWMHVQAAKR
ncbi:hypothetical protein MNBD_GAMMA09-1097 [hydrothermal vent metagenome]|uniref:Peptidase M15C domain-containing protein n=1 Tax=hydrothermal vent metagenome TaxID=652676 RepID=A0A3B0XHB0_9ZZZZ